MWVSFEWRFPSFPSFNSHCFTIISLFTTLLHFAYFVTPPYTQLHSNATRWQQYKLVSSTTFFCFFFALFYFTSDHLLTQANQFIHEIIKRDDDDVHTHNATYHTITCTWMKEKVRVWGRNTNNNVKIMKKTHKKLYFHFFSSSFVCFSSSSSQQWPTHCFFSGFISFIYMRVAWVLRGLQCWNVWWYHPHANVCDWSASNLSPFYILMIW